MLNHWKHIPGVTDKIDYRFGLSRVVVLHVEAALVGTPATLWRKINKFKEVSCNLKLDVIHGSLVSVASPTAHFHLCIVSWTLTSGLSLRRGHIQS